MEKEKEIQRLMRKHKKEELAKLFLELQERSVIDPAKVVIKTDGTVTGTIIYKNGKRMDGIYSIVLLASVKRGIKLSVNQFPDNLNDEGELNDDLINRIIFQTGAEEDPS